jgi:hypothetical protein
MNEQLPIPGWLPLIPKHLKLLEACAAESQVIPRLNFAPRHHLESTGLIRPVNSHSADGDSNYVATPKGLRALRVQRIMTELAIPRRRRSLARSPDNDLVRLLAVLEAMVAQHQRVVSGLQSAPQRS